MACFLAFAPACLYTTGYNHLAYCLCFLGVFLFLSTADRLQSRSRRLIFVPILAGFIHGLMVAGYPVDVLLTPFLFLSLLLYARRVSEIKGKALARLMGLYLIGLLLVAVPFLLYVFFQVGLESMLLFLQAISENPSTTSFADSFARLYRLGVQAFSVLKGMRFGWMLGAAALGGLGVAVFFSAASARERRSGPAGLISGKPFFFRRWLLALLCVYGVACIFVARLHVNLTVQPQMYATLCCLMLPLTLPALRGEDRAAVGRLFLGVGVPSILLTLLNSMASGGGFAQSCYGMIGVFLVTAAAVSLLVRRVFPGEEARSPARNLKGMKKAVGTVLYGVAPLFFAIVLLGLEYGYVYCDNPPIGSCTALVKSGAGAGIRTTPAQAKTLNDMAEDLERAAEGRETLLCLDCFSYGYGLTGRLRPCAPSTWMVSAFAFRDWGIYDAYWTNFFTYCAYRGEEPDVILYAAEKPFSQLYDPAYSLHPYIKENYTCLVEREDYQIFVRNPQANQNTEEPT
jgi:hypothetical protein